MTNFHLNDIILRQPFTYLRGHKVCPNDNLMIFYGLTPKEEKKLVSGQKSFCTSKDILERFTIEMLKCQGEIAKRWW